MLSYQHGFHAGNHADVLKHAVLCYVLDYLLQKDKPLLFFDTHGGRGFYDLQHPMTQKTVEYRDGIARVWGRENTPAGLAPYLGALAALNERKGLRYYAGSTRFARQLLRSTDRLLACELHPQEYLALRDNCASFTNVRVQKEDGYVALKAALPPVERRAAVLIDPSYELLSDDSAVVTALREGLKRFAAGVFLLWYPVVDEKRARKLVKTVAALFAEASDEKVSAEKLLQLELYVREPTVSGGGMAGSGMLVVNPPWQLEAAMREALPWLQQQLEVTEGSGRFVCRAPSGL